MQSQVRVGAHTVAADGGGRDLSLRAVAVWNDCGQLTSTLAGVLPVKSIRRAVTPSGRSWRTERLDVSKKEQLVAPVPRSSKAGGVAQPLNGVLNAGCVVVELERVGAILHRELFQFFVWIVRDRSRNLIAPSPNMLCSKVTGSWRVDLHRAACLSLPPAPQGTPSPASLRTGPVKLEQYITCAETPIQKPLKPTAWDCASIPPTEAAGNIALKTCVCVTGAARACSFFFGSFLSLARGQVPFLPPP